MAKDVGRCGSGWIRRISETMRNQKENWEICHRNEGKKILYGKRAAVISAAKCTPPAIFQTSGPSGRMHSGCIPRG